MEPVAREISGWMCELPVLLKQRHPSECMGLKVAACHADAQDAAGVRQSPAVAQSGTSAAALPWSCQTSTMTLRYPL